MSPVVGDYDINISYVENDSLNETKKAFLERYMPELKKGILKVTTSLYTVNYQAGQNGVLSGFNASADSSGFNSGRRIVKGSKLIFTAKPAEGYGVTKWIVKQGDSQPIVQKNADGSVYVKNTLTIDNILSNIDVNVEFEKREKYQVTYEAIDLSGVAPTGITISSEGLDEDGKATKGSEIVLKAELKPGVAIREWQTSTDGKNWTTRAKSQNTFTIDSLESNLQIRVIINNTDSILYNLQYMICDEKGNVINNANVGTLTATSNGVHLNPGNNVAYIPIDLSFTEVESYEIVRWMVNGETSEELTGYDVRNYLRNRTCSICNTGRWISREAMVS